MRRGDGSAGDVDYGVLGRDYAEYRRPDPRIAARIRAALGDVRTLVNVGAGAGSYEPDDLEVTAVEPSATMRAQRPPGRPPAIDAVAEALPFPDGAFDAALATFTVHQWSDAAKGLGELRRVARGPVVVMTADPSRVGLSWVAEYAPELLAAEAERYPEPSWIAERLGDPARVERVPIPLDCTDGFVEAYYGRPERLLDPGVRGAMSAWAFVPDEAVRRFVRRLGADLADGTWDARHGALRRRPTFDGALVLVVGGRAT